MTELLDIGTLWTLEGHFRTLYLQGPFFARSLLVRKNKKGTHRFQKKKWRKFRIVFFFHSGHFFYKKEKICLFSCIFKFCMFLIRKTLHLKNFIGSQWVITEIREWPDFSRFFRWKRVISFFITIFSWFQTKLWMAEVSGILFTEVPNYTFAALVADIGMYENWKLN